MLARSASAWSAVSRSSAAGTSQVSSMRLALRLELTRGSPPAPMKSAPAQCAGLDAAPGISAGRATAGSSVQKAAAGWTGRMIPVITSCTGPMVRRAPTRRPNRAAVAVVTAACTTSGAAGRQAPGHEVAVAGQRRAVGHLELRLPAPGGAAAPVTGP